MCNTYKTKKEIITSVLLIISMAAWNRQLHENTRDKIFSTERILGFKEKVNSKILPPFLLV